MLDRAVEGHLVDPLASLEETAERARIDDCAGKEMRAGLFPLVEDGNGNLAEPFPDLRRVLEQLAETDRTREPGRARADDEDTDLDALVGRVARRSDVVRRPKRRWNVRRLRHPPLRCFTSSVSFGTTSCTSPTTPRSANSKIGAFASLLIATITPELCIPTLCWIAPEMPQAM